MQNLAIRVSDHVKTQRVQYMGPLGVIFDIPGMAITIDFNHEAEFGTVKINNVITNRLLPEKFVTRKLPHAQDVVPDFVFGGGGIFSIFTGQSGVAFVVG